jgi:hypothetical protein
MPDAAGNYHSALLPRLPSPACRPPLDATPASPHKTRAMTDLSHIRNFSIVAHTG